MNLNKKYTDTNVRLGMVRFSFPYVFEKRKNEEGQPMPAFRDQAILAALPDLCRSLFRKSSPDELNEDQLVELMRQIRFRFSSNVNQIARIVGLTYERAAKLLDRE